MKKFFQFIIVVTIAILIFCYRESIMNKFEIVKDKLASNTYLLENLRNGLESLESDSSLISDSEAKKLRDSFTGVTGEDYQFDSTYYPYYGLLNSEEKILYKQVYENALSVEESFVPICSVSKAEVKKVIEAVYNDHAELFWVGNKFSYKYTKSGEVVWIELGYTDLSNDLTTNQTKFDKEMNQVVKEAKKLSNNYEMELYVHDYLVKTVAYVEGANYNQSAYSAIVLKKSVCAGYARSFQYIMTKLGIPSYYITGNAGEPHAWNIVKLGNGYYNVDVTWDDGIQNAYTYFNRTDSYFSRSHTREGMSLQLPNCQGTTYQYVSPNNTDITYNKKNNKNTSNTGSSERKKDSSASNTKETKDSTNTKPYANEIEKEPVQETKPNEQVTTENTNDNSENNREEKEDNLPKESENEEHLVKDKDVEDNNLEN